MKKEKDFYQISLKLLLKNNNGEVLALKAVDNGSYAGYYDLPGGRIDTDEFDKDFFEIIEREVIEEIGYIKFQVQPRPIAIGRHLIPAAISNKGKDIHVLCVFFEAKYIDGELKISNEHTGYKWIDLSKIKLAEFFKSAILEGIQMYLKNNL